MRTSRVLRARPYPNPMTWHNNRLVEARDGGRPHGWCLYDTAKGAGHFCCRVIEVKGAKAEQEGECAEGGEGEGTQVGRACGARRSLESVDGC